MISSSKYHHWTRIGKYVVFKRLASYFGHIFCLVAKSKLPILGYIHPYQVWLWGQNCGYSGADNFLALFQRFWPGWHNCTQPTWFEGLKLFLSYSNMSISKGVSQGQESFELHYFSHQNGPKSEFHKYRHKTMIVFWKITLL